MNLRNVKLIMLREMRDQLRDRRTLFMIFVLPLLLYPLLGLSFFQVVQFVKANPSTVVIWGDPNLEGLPSLLTNGQIDPRWIGKSLDPALLKIETAPASEIPKSEIAARELAQTLIQNKTYEAIVYFPPSFSTQLQQLQQVVRNRGSNPDEPEPPQSPLALLAAQKLLVPAPIVFCNTAEEKSNMAYGRISDSLRSWIDAIGEQILTSGNVPVVAARPFELTKGDVAEPAQSQALVWSKILPFVLLIWALTGAFYPAIDLCAGEKERGTLETLLSSPAERSEIVTGKLITIMVFSMATALLNIVSMGLTGTFVIQQLSSFGGGGLKLGVPPAMAPVWLAIALVPVSALFSALCLALASFARSNKEGQYYLMPLMLVSMPLMILPMAPGVELTLGNSLIPLTGLILLLRTMLEGNYSQALPYILPVMLVTLACILLAVRWAIDQFNKESVLFRESERFDMGLWLKHLVRDRGDTPSVAEAIFCGVLILVVQFFMSLAMKNEPRSFNDFMMMIVVSQLVVIATPALIMTIMLTRRPRKTLLLRKPPLFSIPFAILLAISLNPFIMMLGQLLQELYPMSQQMRESSSKLMGLLDQAPYAWLPFVLVAVLPAVCEELAFRGFILSGLRHLGHRWQAILISSIFFGIAHQILQQSLLTAMVGMVIGFLAVQTGSLLTGMFFHLTHNAMTVLLQRTNEMGPEDAGSLGMLLEFTGKGEFEYRPLTIAIGAFLAASILVYFWRLKYDQSDEESLQDKIDRRRHGRSEEVAVERRKAMRGEG